MILKRITGLRVRCGDQPGWLPPNASPPLPQIATLTLETEQNEDGYLLLSTSDHEHFTGGDTWHATLGDALGQAEYQFGVRREEWSDVAEAASVSPAEVRTIAADKSTTLYRPVGSKELALIRDSGLRAFPPRLPEQPIFYPVLNEEYAAQIARGWNANHNDDHRGYVTRFQVRTEYLRRFEVKTVGGREHQEYWIPAEELEEFNENIVGVIEVAAEYKAS